MNIGNTNTLTLLDNNNNKFVTKLKEHFTEEEHQLYVANLYMYMNYHPTNEYPINLEEVLEMIGFANKGNAKRTLENNFTKDEDYKITILPSEKGQNSGSKAVIRMDDGKFATENKDYQKLLIRTDENPQNTNLGGRMLIKSQKVKDNVIFKYI
jgi:hypothetical protein